MKNENKANFIQTLFIYNRERKKMLIDTNSPSGEKLVDEFKNHIKSKYYIQREMYGEERSNYRQHIKEFKIIHIFEIGKRVVCSVDIMEWNYKGGCWGQRHKGWGTEKVTRYFCKVPIGIIELKFAFSDYLALMSLSELDDTAQGEWLDEIISRGVIR